MALSQYLEQTAGPAVVQGPNFKTPYAQTVQAMRGTVPVSVQALLNGVAANLPTGATLFYGLKPPANIKGPWLALCQLAAVDLVNSPGLWSGNLALNNVAMRAAMHADINDPLPEVQNLLCLAELYYTLPPVDDVTPDPVGSINFNFSVGAPLVNDTENIAPDPNTPFPSAAALTTAIAQAAAADTPAARNTAITTALAALPAPVNTSAAPIQPFSLWESAGYKFNNFSTGLNVENVGITSIAFGLIIQNASLQNAFGLSVRQNFAGNALDLATVNNGLATLDSLDLSNMIIDFSGGTNAAPTLDVAQVNGVGTLDFGSFDNAFTADGGQLADIFFGLLYLFFDNSLPFSASAGCTDGRSGYICVQDNPAGSDIAAFIAANYSAPTLTLSAAGSVLSVTDATAGNLPLTFSDDAATGTVATITTPGNPPANSYALSIRARGGTVITN